MTEERLRFGEADDDDGRRISLLVKHAFDRLAAVALLGLLSPLFAVVAVAIRLEDGGPVFFRQQRLGIGGEPFTIWKFRTMRVDADRFLDESGVPTAPRVTAVGRVLRIFSLDELPQLLNILRGEMSLVGPRPVLPSHRARYSDEQMVRFRVRPGITGLAQVNGRNQLRWSKRLEYDVEYVRAFSLWLDLKILLRTVPAVFRNEGVVVDRNPGEVDDLPGTRSE